jgi:hypothetical protein
VLLCNLTYGLLSRYVTLGGPYSIHVQAGTRVRRLALGHESAVMGSLRPGHWRTCRDGLACSAAACHFPTQAPQVRAPGPFPTGFPRTERHFPVRLGFLVIHLNRPTDRQVCG